MSRKPTSCFPYLLETAKAHVEGRIDIGEAQGRISTYYEEREGREEIEGGARGMGYRVDNEPFKNHSWYFRNALVRANYEDVRRGAVPTTACLERFFENQLCGARHELRNRYVHLDWPEKNAALEATGTPQVTDQVRALLDALGDRELSAMKLMNSLGLSHRHTFRQNYLNPALEAGLIERTIPDKPTSRLQKYRKARR